MRRILRRSLTRDPNGLPISTESERLADDGRGWLQVTSERTALRCGGCRRPVLDLSELRGVCDWCGTQQCCVHCISRCAVCSRRLCGHCRQGFAGPPPITVCPTCQQRLIRRQELQDYLAMQQTAFEREVAMHRLFNQVQALRLMEERVRLTAQLQAARLGADRRPVVARVIGAIGSGLSRVFNYARRSLS